MESRNGSLLLRLLLLLLPPPSPPSPPTTTTTNSYTIYNGIHSIQQLDSYILNGINKMPRDATRKRIFKGRKKIKNWAIVVYLEMRQHLYSVSENSRKCLQQNETKYPTHVLSYDESAYSLAQLSPSFLIHFVCSFFSFLFSLIPSKHCQPHFVSMHLGFCSLCLFHFFCENCRWCVW